jgi:hypothetical protein
VKSESYDLSSNMKDKIRSDKNFMQLIKELFKRRLNNKGA